MHKHIYENRDLLPGDERLGIHSIVSESDLCSFTVILSHKHEAHFIFKMFYHVQEVFHDMQRKYTLIL